MTWLKLISVIWGAVPVMGEFYLLGWSVHKVIDVTLKKGKIRLWFYGFLVLFRWVFLGAILWAGIRFLHLNAIWLIGGVLTGTTIALLTLFAWYVKHTKKNPVPLPDIHINEGEYGTN